MSSLGSFRWGGTHSLDRERKPNIDDAQEEYAPESVAPLVSRRKRHGMVIRLVEVPTIARPVDRWTFVVDHEASPNAKEVSILPGCDLQFEVVWSLERLSLPSPRHCWQISERGVFS